MLNLVTNSLDAMPDGGTLTIRASLADGKSASRSATRASGIPAELLPRIFDPWVTTKPAGRGTGLGLSITHDVIARHGGTITAVSEPGTARRSRLSCRLPRQRRHVDVQNSDR